MTLLAKRDQGTGLSAMRFAPEAYETLLPVPVRLLLPTISGREERRRRKGARHASGLLCSAFSSRNSAGTWTVNDL